MKNFIVDLCHGEFSGEILKDEDFLRARTAVLDKYTDEEKVFCAQLSPEQKEALEKLKDLYNELWLMEGERLFTRGVKIGMEFQSALDGVIL